MMHFDTYYRGGNERGVKVHNAIKRMVNEGRNGTYTPQDANVTINKVGGLKEETNYYYNCCDSGNFCSFNGICSILYVKSSKSWDYGQCVFRK